MTETSDTDTGTDTSIDIDTSTVAFVCVQNAVSPLARRALDARSEVVA